MTSHDLMPPTRLRLVVPATDVEPFATRDEAIEAGEAAWKEARRLHLQILAKVSDAGMLRLQNAGALPHEDRGARNITVHTLSGLAKDLRTLEELADQAASVLEAAAQRMRKG